MWRIVGLKPLFTLARLTLVKTITRRSLRGLALDYNIPYSVLNDLNAKDAIDWLRSYQPDVTVSSISQLLKDEILSVPIIGFINKHAGLLPAYGGLMPVVHALSKGEKQVGMSIHVMTSRVDGGFVLSQRAYQITVKDSVLDVYSRVYQCVPMQIVEALDVLEGRIEPVIPALKLEPSYYSEPTAQDWLALKNRGYKLA